MVRDFRNHLFLVGIVLVLFLLVGCASQMFAVRETVTVTIRETSDLHGSIASYNYATDAPAVMAGWSVTESWAKRTWCLTHPLICPTRPPCAT